MGGGGGVVGLVVDVFLMFVLFCFPCVFDLFKSGFLRFFFCLGCLRGCFEGFLFVLFLLVCLFACISFSFCSSLYLHYMN